MRQSHIHNVLAVPSLVGCGETYCFECQGDTFLLLCVCVPLGDRPCVLCSFVSVFSD